jgi:hypothetical protein
VHLDICGNWNQLDVPFVFSLFSHCSSKCFGLASSPWSRGSNLCVCVCVCDNWYVLQVKGKAIPLQALTGPEGSRRLRLPDFKKIGTWRWRACQPNVEYQQLLPAGNIPGTHFCQSLCRPQSHSAARRIVSIKNSNDTCRMSVGLDWMDRQLSRTNCCIYTLLPPD